MKAWLIARRLLWQNRWLYLLLALWPYAMAAILLAGGRANPEDVNWIVQQECFAGIGLVVVTGCTLLGNEQRSRRIVTVLSRSVSRRTYLLALGMTAWLPLVLYVSGFLISGSLVMSLQQLFLMGIALLVLGVWAAAISLFWSVLLPQIPASIVSMGCVGLAAYVGQWTRLGPDELLRFSLQGEAVETSSSIWVDSCLTLALAGFWFAAASWFFYRRDLNLSAD